MDPDLYFLSIIDVSLTGPTDKRRARNALKQILILGQQELYQNGLNQFHEWLRICHTEQERLSTLEHALLGTSEDVVWPDSSEPTTNTLLLVVEKNGEGFQEVRFSSTATRVQIDDVTSGRYRVLHPGGWVLWDEELGRDELIVDLSGRKRLRAAAATQALEPGAAFASVTLAEGELTLTVHPGPRSGSMVISRNARQRQ